MKSLTHYRLAAVRVAVAVLILFAGVSAFVSASSLPNVGHTGQALALRSALRRGLPGAFFANSGVPLPAKGRHLSDLDAMQRLVRRPTRGLRPLAAGGALVTINEAVQTFDVFAPRDNNFVPPAGALTPTNQTPVWSSDESFIVFASNMAGDGHTHLFAIASSGDLSGTSSVRQITSGSHDEAFPALNPANNSLAFTSTAGTANGTPNLFVIPFNFQALPVGSAGAVDPATLASLTIRADLTTGFGAVGRPTFSPGGDRIVFAARDAGGATPNVSHLWFLFFGSNGGRVGTGPTSDNPPVKLTSGPAFDADPAYSPDGSYIAFDSTATGIQTNPAGTATGVGTAPTLTTGSQSVRNLFLISGGTTRSQSVFGAVPPTTAGFDGHITSGAAVDDSGPAWSADTQNAYLNPNSVFEYLAWARGGSIGGPHDIYFLRTTELTSANTETITAEGRNTAEGFADGAVKLNTDDNAGETSAGGNVFDDVYPTWSPFASVFSIAYGSNRSVTYNAPMTNVPQEQAVSLAPGTNGVGAAYMGILQSQVLNLDPPLLIPFGGGDVVRVTDSGGRVTRNIQPGQTATFTVRLSNREAGTDPNNVYVQLKDPNSKYQDAQGLEHKVFTKDFTYYAQHPNETYGGANSSVAASIFNGGEIYGGLGFNKINNGIFPQRGAIGGQDGGDTISVGTYTFNQTVFPPEVTPNRAAPVDDTRFLPFGQEYEAQFVNPTVANPGTGAGDFGTPFYLAGVDDDGAFSGSAHPARPTVNTPATGTTAASTAEWIKLTPVTTDANGNPLPDAAGGVLFTATYTTPTAFGSDFYLDTVAYDRATFPAVPVDTSAFSQTSVVTQGQNGPVTTVVPALSTNWRLYDNTGGFTTASFGSSSAVDTLVVADNTLGQKFAAGTFRGRGGADNLPPEFYGAESYFTDIDKNLLPNSVYFQVAPATSPTPPNPGAPQLTATPTNLSATPGNNLVTLVWTGVVNGQNNAPLSYNIYRSLTPGGEGAGTTAPLANIPGNAITTYVDRSAVNGTTYYYEVTAVISAGNETGPSNEAGATPFAPGTTPVPSVQLLTNLVGGIGLTGLATDGPVLNGLGVGSYDDGAIEDGRTIDGVAAVRPQQYSIWRVLSRGPVPASVLQSYAPTFIQQPGFTDPQTGFTAAAAAVPVANRCVIWSSPYTGNLLTSSGSILDTDTQTNLKNFVNSGGRLFVSGATVASAITQNGVVNETATDFLPSVLNATLGAPAAGSQVLTGASAPGNRIGFDAFYNESTTLGFDQNFPMLNGNLTITYQAPSQSPVFELGNNYLIGPIATTLRARTDGSLDQLGPVAQFIGAAAVNGQIDTINAQNAAHTDITFGGLPGLIYNENVGANGGRSIFSSFGLEGMGIEYYKVSNNNLNYYSPRNLRPNILHNVVTYLRTGTFTGTITQRTGAGVPGATVYLISNGGAVIPGSPANRQTFSAVTDSSGQYIIQGVESGAYVVAAFKSGFTRATSQSIGVAFSVEGGSSTRVNLNINPVPPGSLSGVVKDTAGRAVAGATVTFTAADGSGTTVNATTDVNGNYAIANSVSPNSYNGSAQKGTQFGPNPPSSVTAPNGTVTQGNPVPVASGATTIANFILTTAPATLSGVVSDATTGAGLVGATVTLTPTAGGTAVTATTLAATTTAPITPAGFYTVSLPSGSYTVTASKQGYITSGALPLTLQPGQALTQNFALTVAPLPAPGTLGGLVADSFTGGPAGGAIVMLGTSATPPLAVTDINGNTVAPVTTSATATSPGAPTGDGTPQNYAFANLPAGTYTVTVMAHGTTLTLQNLVVTAGAFTRGDFTAANGNALPPLHVFPAGYNFFSTPYDYSALGVGGFDTAAGLNLGTLNSGTTAAPSAGSNRSHVFAWSPALLQYLIDPTPPADGPHLGQGYWVYLLGASEVTNTGTRPATVTYPVGLHMGWNQIGVPSLGAISVSSLKFGDPVSGVTFAQATDVTHHLVLGTLYGYNGTAYVPLTATGAMQPWQAYWIYAYGDTTLQIPTAAVATGS